MVNLKLNKRVPFGAIYPPKTLSKASLLMFSFVEITSPPSFKSAMETHGILALDQY